MKKALIISILLNICFIAYLLFKNTEPKHIKPIVVKSAPEIHYLPNPIGGSQIAEIEVQKNIVQDEQLDKINNYILPALSIKEKQLQETISIATTQKEELTKKDLQLDEMKKEKEATQKDLMIWKNKWMTSVVNSKDSTNSVTANAETDVNKYNKQKNIFSPKKTYVGALSKNPSVTINGLNYYEKEVKPDKDFLELNINFKGIYQNQIFTPYGTAEIIFNPDGKLKPIIGYGYYYDATTGRLLPFWSGGLQFNLIRF